MTVRCLVRSTHEDSRKEVFFSKGAVEKIIQYCSRLHFQGRCQALSVDHQQRILAEARKLASQGLRVLGMARGDSMDSMEFLGMVGLHDPPRPLVISTLFLI